MENLYTVCCGIDVHKKLIVCCLRQGKETEVRQFGASTKELKNMASWLKENNCEKCAMESTGSYWKPVYNILEDEGLDAIVVNAQHMRNVPGRKTDIKDAEWISDLLMCGLLKASYIPDKAQRELREMVGYRKKLTQTRADEVNRLQKILEGANIKISGTISDINGKTGNNLLDFIISGKKFDSDAYDDMLQNKKISTRIKASKQTLIDDMEGVISPAQRKMIEVIRNHICELEKHIKELNEAIEGLLNEEQQEAIELMCEMPGIRETSAEIIIAVIGTDMDHFPTSRHLCSWAGICPGNHESAGVRKSGRTNKGNKLLKSTLIQCAHSAVLHKDSYYYSMYRRIQAHRGKKRAIVAVAHAMLEAIYYMLKDGVVFEDLGSEYMEVKNKEYKIRSYIKKLEHLGVNVPEDVIPIPISA